MTRAVPKLEPAERRMLAAIKGLRAMQGVPVAELCELLHFSRGTWFARMNDAQFTFGEVSKLATRFGVKIQAIADGVAYSQTDDVRRERRDGEQDMQAYLPQELIPVEGEGDVTERVRGHLRLIA